MSYNPPFSVVSINNSTTTPLGAGTDFNGTYEDVTNYAAVSVIITSDVASTEDGVTFTWSPTGTGSFTTTPRYRYRLTDDYGNPLGGQLFTSNDITSTRCNCRSKRRPPVTTARARRSRSRRCRWVPFRSTGAAPSPRAVWRRR